ncbi:MAG TPA: hypothetical protein VNM91_12075, partial [Dehalococcoidia bacterium]|nr:hypothetical protein [Dehalococcoidia bacterium]
MDAWMWVVIIAAIAALVIVAASAAALYQQRDRKRSERLRGQFGPEYDRAVDEVGDRRRAEAKLEERRERVSRLRLREIPRDERRRLQDQWAAAQARFVDEPESAIDDACRLVDEAMRARGYPVGNDFDRQSEDISVEYPYVVDNYRQAGRIMAARSDGDVSTEDLRQAMVHYRALFTELLNTAGAPPAVERPGRR